MTATPSQMSPILRLEAMTKQMQARKLKLTLELVKTKRQRGLPLSLAENELLAECYRRYYDRPNETISVNADGYVVVKRSQNIEPLFNVMKEYKDLIGERRNDRVAGAKMIGSIDPITATNWSKETGLKVGTKEFAQFAKKRMQNDIDYRKFKVGG